ncbi:MAG: ABC transporter ATP-binding protein [Nitriliruptoraceae bacterium]
MIDAHGVGFAYGKSPVLAGIELHVDPGEVVGIIGPNGCGKTTLLRILYRSLEPTRGAVTVDDTPLTAIGPRQLSKRMSVVVQEAGGDLPLTVAEMVLLGRTPHRTSFQPTTIEDHRVAAAALRQVGLRELAHRPFANLSGGERQRVLIARAIAQQADHLLLDEPTNHLDIRYQHEVLQLVRTLPVTTVVVLHDLNLAARYCDRLILLDQGKITASGSTDDVLRPEVLEPVYGIRVRTVVDQGLLQLIFSPFSTTPSDDHAVQEAR